MSKATITKIANAQPVGAYAPTAVDAARAAADVVIAGYAKSRTEIRSSRRFSGAGVKLIATKDGVATYLVTDEALTEIRRRFSVATDF